MRTKRSIGKQLFGERHAADKATVERKLDDAIRLLAQSDLSDKEIHEILMHFNDSLQNLAAYQSYLANRAAVDEKPGNEPDIFIAQYTNSRAGATGKRRHASYVVRIIIAILVIALGFAMIILPAPPYFEMYTIFYFNEQDGFTLMDLISLIIVFSGVFMLIMAMLKDKVPGRE